MKPDSTDPTDDMLEEYDSSQGVRGKYVDRFREGSHIVVLSPDVAEVFRNSGRPYADKFLEESAGAATKIVTESKTAPRIRGAVFFGLTSSPW